MSGTVATISAEKLDQLLEAGALERIGMGSRRACYRMPDGRSCLKCYRSDAEIEEGRHSGAARVKKALATGAVSEIRACRFDKRRNTCCQEYRYWHDLKARLPEDLMAVFPSYMELILLPSRGWAVVEELIVNDDGTPLRKFAEEWRGSDAKRRAEMLSSFNALGSALARHAVRFFDPQTIFIQKTGGNGQRIRIADFEPASRVLIPIERFIPGAVAMKVKRRFLRYLRAEKISTSVGSTPSQSTGPVNVLCLKFGTYYGPEYVNRLYAGVKRNLRRPFRFVCVTDDPKGLRPEVETVPLPDDPGVIGRSWPNIFVKLCVFRNGFANLSGPTLFLDIDVCITGSLDRFFDYKPGEFCIIHNWVERRKVFMRGLPPIGNSSCFRFEAGSSGGVYDIFMAMKDDPAERERFVKGSQKFQTYAMMKTGRVNWWPKDWVCSFKRQCVPLFPLNKLFAPWRPSKRAAVVAFHGQPDLPQALAGYYIKHGLPVKPHLTCKPTKWILDYWHE